MKQIGNLGGGETTAKETLAKIKTSRETVTSSATLQDDNDFVFSVKANTTYTIRAVLIVSASATPGFKCFFSTPSGSSGRANYANYGNYVASDVDITSERAFASSSGNSTPLHIFGFITTSSTAGDITFQWAQNTSNATGTYIERGSTMILTEV